MKGHQRRLFGFLEIQPLVTPEVELSHVETREIASHTVCSVDLYACFSRIVRSVRVTNSRHPHEEIEAPEFDGTISVDQFRNKSSVCGLSIMYSQICRFYECVISISL